MCDNRYFNNVVGTPDPNLQGVNAYYLHPGSVKAKALEVQLFIQVSHFHAPNFLPQLPQLPQPSRCARKRATLPYHALSIVPRQWLCWHILLCQPCAPYATRPHVVPRCGGRGGAGTNFMVSWSPWIDYLGPATLLTGPPATAAPGSVRQHRRVLH